MRRIVSIWLPEFPVERFIRMRMKMGLAPPARQGQPFALAEKGAKGLRLVACDAAARALGLHRGQRLADARAMAPALMSDIHEPHKDAESLLGLARWCERYSPMVSLDGADGLVIDITGAAHLFGGEPEMLADMQSRFARYGFTARIAAAATLGAAWGLARYGPEAAFETLPIEALRIEAEAARTLRRLGLKTVGELMRLPRASLARRFRGEAVPENVLLRLDQAMGVKSEPIVPLVPPPVFLARQAMMEPLISHEGLEAALHELIVRILTDLESAGQGVTRLVLRLFKTDGARLSLPLGLAQPTRDARHLRALFRPKLEQIDAGFGIDALTLEAREAAPLGPRQYGFMEDTGTGPEALAQLSDRVSNRHAGGGLSALTPVPSHIPERAETVSPAGSRMLADGPLRERPLLLFDRPESLSVIAAVPDGPPMRFTWRRVARRIVKAEGPERIAPEWWKPEEGRLRPRDYYVVEDAEGRRYWLYREGLYGEDAAEQPKWFIHGLFP